MYIQNYLQGKSLQDTAVMKWKDKERQVTLEQNDSETLFHKIMQ